MSARNIDYTDVRERCAANRDRERFYPNPEGDLIAALVPPRDQQTIDSTEDFVTQLAQLERGVSWDRDSSRASLRSTSLRGGIPKLGIGVRAGFRGGLYPMLRMSVAKLRTTRGVITNIDDNYQIPVSGDQ